MLLAIALEAINIGNEYNSLGNGSSYTMTRANFEQVWTGYEICK